MPDRVAPLALHKVDVQFSGVHAVDGVTAEIRPGITGIIGPNGAGKTTLFNAITGYVPLTSGSVDIFGTPITASDPVALRRKGLSRTFQHLELFSGMSVHENIVAGLHYAMRAGLGRAVLRTRLQRAEERMAAEQADALCAQFGLLDVRDEIVGSLPYGNQKLVALARAMIGEPRLLLLDEPASGLTEVETMRIAELLQRTVAERTIDIVLVEHNMRFVALVAEWVLALNLGRLLSEGTPDHVLNDPAVVNAYLGGARV